MTDIIPTLTHATERDIDLLIVEEALASRRFVEWIAIKLQLPLVFETWEVLHSKRRTRSRREIDICIETFGHDRRPIWVLLIENKIDANEQPDQAESYREELEQQYDGHQVGKMALVCPEEYSHSNHEFSKKFDSTITYEEVIRYFDNNLNGDDEAKRRSKFRRDCFSQAIHKYRRGYRKIGNPTIRDFNSQYVQLMRDITPALKPGKTMLGPTKPNESVSMILDNSSLSALPAEIRPRRFSIELGKGQSNRANYVAITFAGWGRSIEPIKQNFDVAIKDDLTRFLNLSFSAKPPNRKRPNPGLVVSSTTCPISNQEDFGSQKDLIADGLLKADLFREWLEAHQSLLREWKAIAEDS